MLDSLERKRKVVLKNDFVKEGIHKEEQRDPYTAQQNQLEYIDSQIKKIKARTPKSLSKKEGI